MPYVAQPPLHRVSCRACPLRECDAFLELESKQIAFVDDLKSGEFQAEAGSLLFLEGSNSAHLFTVLDGWAVRYKELPDGRRQILNYALPGDLIGLQSALFDNMRHSIEALTDVTLCKFERSRFFELFETQPQLAFDVTWLAAREEKILGEHLLNVGRRSATERIAFILLHLYDRLDRLKRASGDMMQMPLTQQHLADTLGLSLVHTNKSLKKLSDLGLIAWHSNTCRLLDRERLEALAHYDEADVPPERPLL